MANTEPTISFSIKEDREKELKKTLTTVYEALLEKGYNPINQLVGYILSEDPTYITTHNNARGLIRHIDRDELLQVLLRSYLERQAPLPYSTKKEVQPHGKHAGI